MHLQTTTSCMVYSGQLNRRLCFEDSKVKSTRRVPACFYVSVRLTRNSSSGLWKEAGKYAEGPLGSAPQQDGHIAAYKENLPAQVLDSIKPYLVAVQLLGRRTAELHLALASELTDPAFAPEPY